MADLTILDGTTIAFDLDGTLVDSALDVIGAVNAVSTSKPDAAHLIEAVAAVGGDIRRSIMIGDAEPDARSARSAGIPLILVSFGYSETPISALAPDILLHQFGDLTGACCELVGGRRPCEAFG